jgi:hypothetical protein
MATRVGIALLGLTCGGVTFLITGLLTFLVINGVQERTIQARTPAAETGVQYAALPPAAQWAAGRGPRQDLSGALTRRLLRMSFFGKPIPAFPGHASSNALALADFLPRPHAVGDVAS